MWRLSRLGWKKLRGQCGQECCFCSRMCPCWFFPCKLVCLLSFQFPILIMPCMESGTFRPWALDDLLKVCVSVICSISIVKFCSSCKVTIDKLGICVTSSKRSTSPGNNTNKLTYSMALDLHYWQYHGSVLCTSTWMAILTCLSFTSGYYCTFVGSLFFFCDMDLTLMTLIILKSSTCSRSNFPVIFEISH